MPFAHLTKTKTSLYGLNYFICSAHWFSYSFICWVIAGHLIHAWVLIYSPVPIYLVAHFPQSRSAVKHLLWARHCPSVQHNKFVPVLKRVHALVRERDLPTTTESHVFTGHNEATDEGHDQEQGENDPQSAEVTTAIWKGWQGPWAPWEPSPDHRHVLAHYKREQINGIFLSLQGSFLRPKHQKLELQRVCPVSVLDSQGLPEQNTTN